MPLIAEIYIVCAVGGALVLMISAALGFVGHTHVGGQGGHGAAGHGGLGSTGHGGGHGAGHGGAHATGGHGAIGHGGGHGVGGHSAGAHSGAHGAAGQSTGAHSGAHGAAGHAPSHGAPAHGGAGHSTAAHSGAHGAAQGSEAELPMSLATAHLHPHGNNQDQFIAFATLINPTTLSVFAVWFGACGLIGWRLLPLPIELTLVGAVIGGLLGTKLSLHMMSVMVSRMYSSASFRKDSLIGYEAEVTVLLEAGRTGEISCVARGPSYTISARCLHPNQSFKRGDRVIISDIRDDIAYVEAWPEDVLPLDDEAADDATLDSPQSRKQPQTPSP